MLLYTTKKRCSSKQIMVALHGNLDRIVNNTTIETHYEDINIIGYY